MLSSRRDVIIVFGVSGVGKSTIGKQLAEQLNLLFFDADDFHPQANIDKMAGGVSLNDEDRLPWLQNLNNQIRHWQDKGGAVLACSALKESYRQILQTDNAPLQWVLLNGDQTLIRERINKRSDHFMDDRLLNSQFNTLEVPHYGIKINVYNDVASIVQTILQKLNNMDKSEIGLIGLGVMGKSLALNILDNGFKTAVYNRSEGEEVDVVSDFINENASYAALNGYTDLKEFVEGLESPRRIVLMIKAGKAIDSVIDALLPYLKKDDIILDGGNSHYKDSLRRQELLSQNNLHFIGCGISGGEEGARKGPAIMPGGKLDAYKQMEPVLNAIAAKDKNNNPCSGYIGAGGAGHFVKMIHNGIEYAEMQLLAEMYHLLKHHNEYEEIASLFEEWNSGDQGSYLLEITIDILRKKEGDQYLLDFILDKAGNKGTGSWSSKAAYDYGSAATMMAGAVFARYVSSFKDQRVRFGIDRHEKHDKVKIDPGILRNAYSFARWINHIQGLELIRTASDHYNWGVDILEVCRIWTNGCIIRSNMIESIMHYLKDGTALLNHASLLQNLHQQEDACADIVSAFIQNRIPSPVFSNALNYWLAMTSEKLPANLIQAQRDFFGAHTYNRTDAPVDQFFHTQW